jgi:hypothetical protein
MHLPFLICFCVCGMIALALLAAAGAVPLGHSVPTSAGAQLLPQPAGVLPGQAAAAATACAGRQLTSIKRGPGWLPISHQGRTPAACSACSACACCGCVHLCSHKGCAGRQLASITGGAGWLPLPHQGACIAAASCTGSALHMLWLPWQAAR